MPNPHPWHARPAAAVLAELRTTHEGLAHREAARRLSRHGPNALAGRPPPSAVVLFLRQFQDLMVVVLLGATLVSLALGEVADALTILAIVLVNAFLGFFQEQRAESSLARLKALAAPTARIRRQGEEMRLPAERLVPGDVFLLEAGDRVPADGRLLAATRLACDESLLTGESLPAEKSVEPPLPDDLPVPERRNMVYMGTNVVRGRAEAVAVATGMRTEMGRIAALMDGPPEPTPLEKRLERVGRVLVAVCLGVTALVTAIGLLRGEDLLAMVLAGVSLAVAAVPEGLPAIVTIALAVGVQRMIRRCALVRRLPAVETLGSASVICSDKTGTLSQNRMAVQEVLVGGRLVSVVARDLSAPPDADVRSLVEAAALCCDAELGPDEPPGVGSGDPTELALLSLARRFGLDPLALRRRHPRLAEEPFDSETRQMAVTVAAPGGPRTIWKGAPEVLLARATVLRRHGASLPLTAARRAELLAVYRHLAEQGRRGLAVAVREGSGPTVFLGLLALSDPPRPEAKAAVAACRAAGITVAMVTGDHPATALAFARELDLAGAGAVLTGAELDRLSDEELRRRVGATSVFARITPQQKLRLVRAFQANGAIVAMTGDGVNDAPALKEADIGIAMGRGGTDVARQAADLVLLDDNFASIVAAVEEGRGIYENVRKVVRYLLSCNIGEVLLMLFAVLLGLRLPLTPIQVLWVNLVTDGLPALALALDPADPAAMRRPPRPPTEGVFGRGLGVRILTRGFLIGAVALGVYAIALGQGRSLPVAQTLTFATLILSQLLHAFDCRSETRGLFAVPLGRNPWLLAAIASSLALTGLALYVPPFPSLIGNTAIPLAAWPFILVAAALPSTALGLRQATRARRARAALRRTR